VGVRGLARHAGDPSCGGRSSYADELGAVLEDRPLAFEEPAPTLTALANRVVGYLETV
jgi:hypothetical protein